MAIKSISQYIIFLLYAGGVKTRFHQGNNGFLRVLLFSVFLSGNVVFMSYRASLTAELAVKEDKMPFTTLEGLLNSDYGYMRKDST